MTKTFNYRLVFRILGLLLFTETFFLLLAAVVALGYGETDFLPLLESAGITALGSLLGYLAGYRAPRQLGVREGYCIVAVVWVFFSLFGMLPFLLNGSILTPTDAFFETMSGFTTTGASILTNIEALPHGLLFWRSLIQWLGGMGIVVLSLAVLPFLGGNMQLFMAEVPGPTYDKLQPRITNTARQLWGLYVILTGLEAIVLYIGGMPLFDAICHALTTMATGGYSTKQDSIAYWDSPFIQYTIIVFMILAGTNFALLYWAFIKRRFDKLWHDEELRTYLLTIAAFTLTITLGLVVYKGVHSITEFEKTFRESLFQVVSIITTTGFSTTDYMLWKPVVWALLLLLMLSGGSAGSTSGGLKIIRLLLVCKNGYYEMKRLIHPKAILPVRINQHVVPENTISNIHAFTVIYVGIIIISTFVVALSGMSLGESFGAALTAISNVGPGIGSCGPAGNFADIPTFAKWFLAFVMLIGRLELFTVLVLFSPTFWKK
ncbi:MAG: TrkH family potassium uptake protein [Paludibacteraceae bacterium]